MLQIIANNKKIMTTIRCIFLLTSFVITAFWFQEIFRAADGDSNLLLVISAVFIFNFISVVAMQIGDTKKNHLIFCGIACIIIALISGILIYFNATSSPMIPIFPSAETIKLMFSSFNINAIYWFFVDSWLLVFTHIVCLASGITSLIAAAIYEG